MRRWERQGERGGGVKWGHKKEYVFHEISRWDLGGEGGKGVQGYQIKHQNLETPSTISEKRIAVSSYKEAKITAGRMCGTVLHKSLHSTPTN